MKSVEQERETQWDWERESIKCTENSVRFKKYQTTVTAIIFPFQYQCTQFHIYDNASDVCMVGMLKFTFEIFPLNYMDIRAEASFVVSNGLVKFIPSPMITDSIFMTKKNTHTQWWCWATILTWNLHPLKQNFTSQTFSIFAHNAAN